MTTHSTPSNDQEHDDNSPDLIPIEDALTTLLSPYLPAEDMRTADKLFTTNELIQALELHYGVPQGSTDYFTGNAGIRIVKQLQHMGFRCANTGDLQLQWLMKKA